MMFRTIAALALAASVALAGDPNAEAAKGKVDALKAAKDPEAKKKAIADAGTCASASVAAALGALLADADDGVRVEAARALGSMKGLADAARALSGGVAANGAKNDVLKAIFDAMGAVGKAEALPALKDFTAKHVPLKGDKDTSGDATAAAINAVTAIKCKAAVEILLDLYKKQVGIGMDCSKGIHAPVYSAISGGLKTLTGQTFNSMPGEAELWWRKHKDEFNDDMTKK